MKYARTMAPISISAAIATLTPGVVHSGSVIEEMRMGDVRGRSERIEFNEKGQLRIFDNGLDKLVLDGRTYVVGNLDGKPTAVDMLAATRKSQGETDSNAPSFDAPANLKSLEPTGRKQTVAGIEGEVFKMTSLAQDEEYTDEFVLTRDSRLSVISKAKAKIEALTYPNSLKYPTLAQRLASDGYFSLKSANFVVTAISFDPIPSDRFELKAKPVDDMAVFFALMSANQAKKN